MWPGCTPDKNQTSRAPGLFLPVQAWRAGSGPGAVVVVPAFTITAAALVAHQSAAGRGEGAGRAAQQPTFRVGARARWPLGSGASNVS
jgi:hypothetical protein